MPERVTHADACTVCGKKQHILQKVGIPLSTLQHVTANTLQV